MNLQKYNFNFLKPDEVILFEWLLSKSRSFGHDWFFYSGRRIFDETGIKRNRQDKIFAWFAKNKFLKTETRGAKNQRHFFLDWSIFYREAMFKAIYKHTNKEIITFWENINDEFLAKYKPENTRQNEDFEAIFKAF